MLDGFSTPRNGFTTLAFIVLSGLLTVAAAAIGIDDNLPGVLAAFLAGIALLLAFVHPWRDAGKFRRLLFASFLGFVISVILHNVFEGIASTLSGGNQLQGALNGIGVVFFFIAILICPAGLLVGGIGWIVMHGKDRYQPSQEPQ